MEILTIAAVDNPTADARLKILIDDRPGMHWIVRRRGWFQQARFGVEPNENIDGFDGAAEHVRGDDIYVVVVEFRE